MEESRPPPALATPTRACSDWYATLLGLAGLDPFDKKAASSVPVLPPVDSKNVWDLISGATATSPHVELPVSPNVLINFTHGGPTYKLIEGVVGANAGWFGPTYPNASSPASDPSKVALNCTVPCLFNVDADPSEYVDIAAQHPDVVKAMQARLAVLREGMFSNRCVHAGGWLSGCLDACGSFGSTPPAPIAAPPTHTLQ